MAKSCYDPLSMGSRIAFAAALVWSATVAAEDKKPPDKLVFPSKSGQITFDHSAHLTRRNGHCAPCHDKLWPKTTAEPLKSSDGCRTCHQAGGVAFEMKGNCKRCHATKSGAE
jgi:c(7)-type cytochrome triheme protein